MFTPASTDDNPEIREVVAEDDLLGCAWRATKTAMVCGDFTLKVSECQDKI